MKKLLLPLALLAPSVASAHTINDSVGHLHPHGIGYALIAVIAAGMALRAWLKR
ncbi:hypothetical protein [Rhodalgimonas zhirmunskyi]|uniref:HupE / UreJ protein n=1 Tax=Rhodalgimonas zhirmunskyi TaxID=2964767 RepID=A0AAJ1UD08_9RHOB|nr:hypothetical protein [Rhodoalgimonas zhirmunskyi]MDQ2093642.1 hypothetical protein [Rhodoalgimonas zhirmunskyi]